MRARPANVAVVVAPLIVLWIGIATHQWFVEDEWAFIVRRDRPGLAHPGAFFKMLLAPHNEHWLTIPVIMFRAVFGVVGLKAYWPYLAMLMACHALVLGLLVRRGRLDQSGRWIVAALVAILGVHGAGAENLLWAFQIAFVLPIAFGLVHLECEERGAHRWGWAAGVAAVMCSAVGIAVVGAVATATLVRVGWRAALRAASVPAVVYALWFMTYGRAGTVNTAVDWSTAPFQAVPYAWRSLTLTVDRTIGFDGVGPLVIGAMIVAVVVWWPWLRNSHSAALGLAAGDIAFLLLVALGREAFGDPGAGRYAYVNLALLIPLGAVLLTRLLGAADAQGALLGTVDARKVLAGALAVVALAVSGSTLATEADRTGQRDRSVRDHVTAAFVAARSPFASGSAVPDGSAPDLTINDVRSLAARGIVPWGQPSAQALTDIIAKTSGDITGRPARPIDGDAVRILALARATGRPVESGCVRLTPTGPTPQIVLIAHQPASIKVVPYAPGQLVLTVRTDRRAAVATVAKVAANNPVFVNLANPEPQYVLTVPTGDTTTICGIGQQLP